MFFAIASNLDAARRYNAAIPHATKNCDSANMYARLTFPMIFRSIKDGAYPTRIGSAK